MGSKVFSKSYTGQKYAVERLVTDTIAYDVVRATAMTVHIRRRTSTRETAYVGPGQYPVVEYVTVGAPESPVRLLRRRKDGTYRTGDGMRPLSFTDEPPTVRVDWSY